MIGRSRRGRVGVLATRTSACAAVLAALVCADSGDGPCGNSWYRVGDLLRNVVEHTRPDRREQPVHGDDSRPLAPSPVDPSPAPSSDVPGVH